jgi:hypothetical protein
MKANHLIRRIRIVLLCLAWLVALVAIPLLAKAAANWMGDLIKPDQYEISPILAPLPPPPMASNKRIASSTPAPSYSAAPLPQAIPVPTPPAQVALPDSALAQNSTLGAAARPTIHVITSGDAIAGSVTVILLLILIWWRRASGFRSMHQECAS